jgi:choice-of-anchor B domain-containing protein
VKQITLLIVLLSSLIIQAQTNVELVGNLDQYPSVGYNDIWGYVDQSGTEYALIGTKQGTSIINLSNPANPVESAFIPGPQSTWRDIKVHSHYAYIITEGTGSGNGLQIVDLSQLPASATLVNTLTTWFERAHNIFIDNGYAFVIGTNGGGGMHILDLSDPVNPVRTAYYTQSSYIHDVYVWDDTVIAAAEDTYDLIDITNKSNPQLISSSAALPGIYAHSGWMTEDKRYFIGAEEFDVRDITIWDLQDRTSWDLVVSSWHMPGGSGTDPVHNIFVKGNYAHISYYKHGYVVLDISDPANPFLAGEYDTYPSGSGTYNGAWGCYPYLPSGITIISDIQTGLYVFQFEDPLPVELSSFTAAVNKQDVTLNWSTASETNNLGFEIQRKSDHGYNTIGFVEGNGSTVGTHNYSFRDENLQLGNYSYRLKQVDFDGSINYSDEINVDIITLSEFVLNQNYPNPFNPTTTIDFTVPSPEFVTIEVYNSLGERVIELVNQMKEAGAYTIEFNAANLPSGIYFARMNAGSYSQLIKMNLIK